MSPLVLGAMMVFAAVAIGTGVGWVLVAATTSLFKATRYCARTRAQLFAQLRLFPLGLVVAIATSQVNAFLRFETNRPESAGPLLFSLSIAGAVVVLDALWRTARCWYGTTRIVAKWKDTATPLLVTNWAGPAWMIRPAYPIVAVVGALRPQLFVANEVVDGCSSEEFAAIAAHEAAHVAAADNLIKLLFALTPGAALAGPVARDLELRWQAAAEEAADDEAGRDAGFLELASALTKVARLASAPPLPAAAASALISHSELDARVRRLIQPPKAPERTRVAWLPCTVLLLTAISAQAPGVARVVHELFELLVRSH